MRRKGNKIELAMKEIRKLKVLLFQKIEKEKLNYEK